ncbi:WAG22 antigen-like isoform X2 [Macrobrachium rosenbergii]
MAQLSTGCILQLFLLGMASAITQVSPPTASTSSPWMDTSLCPLTDSLMVCQLKKGMCSPINTIFSPPGGPVKAITICANATGAVLGPQFFMSVGLSFLAGAPESLADKASSDPATATAIRRCALNTTGLLNPDLLTLNRTAVSNSLSDAFITPDLGAAVAAAVASCPEPVDYKLTDFLHCLKVACMNNVAVTPFMNEATSLLTGAAAPATSAAAIVAAKTPPAPKSPPTGMTSGGVGAFPYAGAAGGASGAGAFPYAGAFGGASGAGAFPFAGAAGGASGAGAFPFAGAAGGASGAGAFPYAGASSGGASGAGSFPFAGASGGGASGAGAFPYAGAASGTSGAGAFPYAGGAAGTGGAGAFTASSGGASVSKTT